MAYASCLGFPKYWLHVYVEVHKDLFEVVNATTMLLEEGIFFKSNIFFWEALQAYRIQLGVWSFSMQRESTCVVEEGNISDDVEEEGDARLCGGKWCSSELKGHGRGGRFYKWDINNLTKVVDVNQCS